MSERTISSENPATKIEYRPGTDDLSFAVFKIFAQATADLTRRFGYSTDEPGELDPGDAQWKLRRPLFEHLARTAEHFWLAYEDGQPVGYARSVLRDRLLDLTEFFVLPRMQSSGVGRELLRRTFPRDEARYRAIIATSDLRALARYLKAGVYARFPIYNFSRTPRLLDIPLGLEARPVTNRPEDLQAMDELDRAVAGHARPLDHLFWLSERPAFLYLRNGLAVGYGYAHRDSGPFALLDARDYPAVLAHAEREAAAFGVDRLHLEVPLINAAAVDWLLENGYKMDPFSALFMSNQSFGQFENYIFPSPPFTV